MTNRNLGFAALVAAGLVLVIVVLIYVSPASPSLPTPLPATTTRAAQPTPSRPADPTASTIPAERTPATTAAASPTPMPVTPDDEWLAVRPARDLVDLRARYGPMAGGGEPNAVLQGPLRAGAEAEFWLADQRASRYDRVNARLAVVSEHAYFFVQEGLTVPTTSLERSAAEFDRTVYPSVTRHFGRPATPGIDGDPRVYILLARLSGVAGYHNSADLFSRKVHPYSNQREIIYVTGTTPNIGGSSFGSLLAHEFQHLVRANEQPVVDNWVNEGSSELATVLAGYGLPASARAFLAQPDTQLTAWEQSSTRMSAHYGAAYLFLQYVEERLGPDALTGLRSTAGRGVDLFDAYLARVRSEQRFDDLFADWVVANYLDAPPTVADGRFGYEGVDPRPAASSSLGLWRTMTDSVAQYGARYYVLDTGDSSAVLTFTGERSTKLLPIDPRGGLAWWSNTGDLMNSRLTTTLDLSGVDGARLRFRAWYDVEEDYDYAYVSVSRDLGRTWTALQGSLTTTANPMGNSFGAGYSGNSEATGGGWVEEEVDLSSFAGHVIQLRFEYVTDDGYNGRGFAIDDIAVPEIGFFDGADSDGAWVTEGFVRTDNRLPQKYALRLIRQGVQVAVEDIPVRGDGTAKAVIPALGPGEKAVLAVAAMAPATVERAPFTLLLERAPAPATPAQGATATKTPD